MLLKTQNIVRYLNESGVALVRFVLNAVVDCLVVVGAAFVVVVGGRVVITGVVGRVVGARVVVGTILVVVRTAGVVCGGVVGSLVVATAGSKLDFYR